MELGAITHLTAASNDVDDEVIDKLKGIDLNTTTPIEAMGILFDLKKMLE